MKKFSHLALLLLFCGSLSAQQTPNLHLTIPPNGTFNWGTAVNNNFSLIDTWSLTALTNNGSGLQTMAGPLRASYFDSVNGYKINGAAPLNHCLVGNGTYYIDSASCGSGGSVTLQTNGVANSSQSLLNFVNPASFNGLSFTFSNPSGGQQTFTVGGTLGNAGLTNSSTTVNGVPCTLGGACAPGVSTVNTNAGPLVLSFSTGAGSCTFAAGTTTCTITGTSTGTGTVTNFLTGTWPSWLTPAVTNSTTTPTLAVTATAIPNAALANSTIILGGTTLTLGGTSTSVTGLTVDGVSPTTMGFVDATSSIQTQLNGKQGTLTLTTTGSSGAATLIGGTLNIPQYSGGGGSGTVTSFSAGALSPLFTTSVATATTTPALTFALSNAAQNSVLAGPASGGAGAPSYQTAPTLSGANLTALPTNTALYPTLNQSTTGTAAHATALASTPAQCSNGQFATGVTAAGVANCNANLNDGTTTASTLTYTGSGGIASPQVQATGAGTGQLEPAAGLFSSLPTCTTAAVGFAIITDSTTQTWGATATGTGTPATPYTAVFCDGALWTVMGK